MTTNQAIMLAQVQPSVLIAAMIPRINQALCVRLRANNATIVANRIISQKYAKIQLLLIMVLQKASTGIHRKAPRQGQRQTQARVVQK